MYIVFHLIANIRARFRNGSDQLQKCCRSILPLLEVRDCSIALDACAQHIACFIWLCAGVATTEYYFDVHAACAFQWSKFQRNQILASFFSPQLKYKLIRDFPGSEITEENIDAFLSEAVANGDFGLPYIG